MRYLSISLLFIVVACASYPKRNGLIASGIDRKEVVNNPFFSDTKVDYVYKANIKVFKKTFGGLLIVKKIADNHHRVAFTTEMGNKIFDFSFNKETFKVNYILDEINKKMVVKVLQRDFSNLLVERHDQSTLYKQKDTLVFNTGYNGKNLYYFYNENQLYKLIEAGNRKEKVVFLFSEINDNIARRISIQHQNVPLSINLKYLK